MTIVCAKSTCTLEALPAFQKKLASYVTLLCADGQGRHKHNSIYAHVGCAEDLPPSLIAKAGYLPYSHEIVLAYDPVARRVSEHRTNAYYFCGHPGCLASLLKKYGGDSVRQVLETAEKDPGEALRNMPLLDAQAHKQLTTAIEQVGKAQHPRRTEDLLQKQLAAFREQRAAEKSPSPPPVEVLDVRTLGVMNVLLLGAGAVGSYLASKLSLAGHDVVVLDRPEQAAAIRSAGFRLQEDGQVRAAQPAATVTSLPEAFPPGVEYDLLILATKAYDAPAALKQLPLARFPLPRKVMTVQNGIGIEEAARRLLGAGRILAASLTTPVAATAPGDVMATHGGRGLGLAPLAKQEPIDEWVDLFQKAGINTQAYSNYRAMKWSKLLLNVVANATCAILNRKPAVIYRYRPTFMLERAMLKETLAVMKKTRTPVVDLPGSPARLLALVINYLPAMLAQMLLGPQIESGRGNKMPSFHLDLQAGRKQSEVVFLNGAVVRHGRELGLPTPVNFVLTDTLHKLCNGLLLWDDFRGKPDALLARVRSARE